MAGGGFLKNPAPQSDSKQSGHVYNKGKNLVKPVTASPKKMILKLTEASGIFYLCLFLVELILVICLTCKNL